MRKVTQLLVLLFLTLAIASPPAVADPSDHPSDLLDVLNAIDIVPTQEMLLYAGAGQDGEALRAVIVDPELPRYTRVRAVYATELLSEAFGAQFFADLATQAEEDLEVRIAAIAVISRSTQVEFAPVCDALLEELFEDPVSEIHRAVIRATRRLSDERAEPILDHGSALSLGFEPEVQDLLNERIVELPER